MTELNSNYDYDIAIIGSGPGGYTAALRASELNQKVIVIENEAIGGTCLNWGCIATKALLASSEIMRIINEAETFGIKVNGNIEIDYPIVMARKQKVIEKLGAGIRFLFKKTGVEFLEGRAFIKKADSLEIKLNDGSYKEIKSKNIIIATGARPAIIKGLETDGELVFNSRQALSCDTLPKNVLIIGGGAVGLEFADMYHDFGADVTLIEAAKQIVPSADKEVAFLAAMALKKQGLKILTSTKVLSLEKDYQAEKVTATIEKNGNEKEVLTFDRVIVAIGVVPATDNLGLDNLPNIKLDKGHIITNEFCSTGEKGVFAIGDITNAPSLAHKAMAEGILCAEYIAGGKELTPINTNFIPYCIYTHPQIAGFGISEQKAKELELDYSVGKFPLQANGKAVAMGRPEGLIKIIKDKQTGNIIGGAMVGSEVTELINALIPLPLKDKIFPHPTLSEAIPEALRAINKQI